MWGTMLSYMKKMFDYIGINFYPKDTHIDVHTPIEDKVELIVPIEGVPASNVTGYGTVQGVENGTYIKLNGDDDGPIWF